METTTAQSAKPIFEMVTKDCQNCNRPFKVLSTSKTTTCSRSCMEAQGITVPKPDFVKMARLKKQLAAKGIKPTDELAEAVDNFVEDVDPADESEFDEDSRPRVEQKKITSKPPPEITKKPIAEASRISPALPEPNVIPIKKMPIFESPPVQVADKTEAKWTETVEKAKAFVLQISKCRLQIAELALEVCDVRWGGGAHWANHEGTYTLKRFAEEIGVNPKTLSNWVRVKRNVMDKLIEAGEEVDPMEDWSAMTRVADRTKHDADPEAVKTSFASWDKKRVKAFNHAQYVLQMRRKTKSFRHFVENVAKPGKIDGAEIQEMKHDMQAIIKWVRQNGSRFK